MRIADLKLFYCYAIPCGELGIKLKLLDKTKVETARNSFFEGKLLKNPEKIFPTAVKLLEVTARLMGRSVIDKFVIRRYFWQFHDEHVKDVALLVKNFPKEECMVWPGRMLTDNLVEIPFKKKIVKKELTPNIKPNDFVTVHYDYVCEKISEEEFKEFWKISQERRRLLNAKQE